MNALIRILSGLAACDLGYGVNLNKFLYHYMSDGLVNEGLKF